MEWLRYLTMGLVLMTGNCLAASQPLSLHIHNISTDDFIVDASKSSAANINLDDLKTLEKQILAARSDYTFILRTTDEPASLTLVFRSLNTHGATTENELGTWSYVEQYDNAETCYNVSSKTPYSIDCTGNDDIDQPQMTLTLNDSKAEPIQNTGPISFTIINDSDDDLSIFPQDSDNLNSDAVYGLRNDMVYAHDQTTYTVNRTGYPARLLLVFKVSEAEGTTSNILIGEWEYVEADGTAYPCHRAIQTFPFSLACLGVNDLVNPSATLTITEGNIQNFPKPN